MSEAPSDPVTVALNLAEVFDARGIPYALGGAIAYGLWGIPRATVDVDVNVFVRDEELGRVTEGLCALGATMDLAQAREASEHAGMFVTHLGGWRVDVFTPSIPFAWEACQTRVRCVIEGRSAWFLSAESTAVFKLLFFRAKDLVDLERLVAVQGARLDAGYVRRWIVEMMGEDDERVERWDRIVTTHGAA